MACGFAEPDRRRLCGWTLLVANGAELPQAASLLAWPSAPPSAYQTVLYQLWMAPACVTRIFGNPSLPATYWLPSNWRAPCRLETSPSQVGRIVMNGTPYGALRS